MARRPQGSVRKSPRLKQGKPKPPGVGRPSPKPKKSKPKQQGSQDRFDKFRPKIDRMPTVRRAMGGQASEGAARGALRKRRTTERQRELMDMLDRLYGSGKPKNKIVPKKKPKKDPPSAMQKILKNLNRKEILVRAKDKRKK